ncbi:undecaprenyl-diphosphatase BcrC [bacterium BMS3Abin05]|nr:undecaprenyl-diphosphatase BcrC [bacterium BMS3Abin05]GBE26595.1 undecaprenyl-diphosphatase BcrC [bacterium BMS3Bbin03]HDZ11175.1 phosphatase PAP2 family protein [Bacteroidota bacterium]
MLALFVHLDTILFNLFNQTLANPVLDWIMPRLTNLNNWRLPLLLIWLALMFWGGRKGRTAAILIILTIALSDQISSAVIKPFVHRIRPCHVIKTVHLLVGCSGSFSFPSSHATNSMAAASLFAGFYPKIRWYLYTLAGLIAFSRVYVGVHYPFDVITGAILGFLIGWLIVAGYKKFLKARIEILRENANGL